MIDYITATTSQEYISAGALFREYAQSIKIDLDFQQFDKELGSLQKMYAPPHGGIILAKEDDQFIGCVAIRRITDFIGELKRMYVKPGNQNKGIGQELLNKALLLAQKRNYERLRLDTLSDMLSAIRLYNQAGFYEIPAYYANPIPTAMYFEKLL